jgi:hypothetical protein
LGWGTGNGWGAVVAWLLIPLALPFGDANRFAGDETEAMVLLAVESAAISTVLIFAAAGARVLYNRHRLSRAREAREASALQALDQQSVLESGLRDAGPVNPPTAAHRR